MSGNSRGKGNPRRPGKGESRGSGKPAPRGGRASGGGRAKAPPEGFRALQRGLTGERELIGKSYMDDPEMLAAYLGYYWPASRAQCLEVLDRLAFLASRRNRLGLSKIVSSPVTVHSLIDVGSGPGPIAAAFAFRGATRLSLIDQSVAALDLARKRLSASPGVSVATLPGDVRVPDPSAIDSWGEADCVAFGHSLNELWRDRADRVDLRAGLLERYAGALAPGGFILAIEPALLETSRDLLSVRNLLVSRGWRVLAPCPGRESLPCPALEAGPSQTCHETARWDMPEETARLARSMGLDREWLKMTWFALLPPAATSLGDPGELAPASVPGDRDPTGGKSLFRVVSDPMLNKGGRVRRLLCGERGRFPLSAPSAPGETDRTGLPPFDGLVRGDFVTVDGPETRENGWGAIATTSIGRVFP